MAKSRTKARQRAAARAAGEHKGEPTPRRNERRTGPSDVAVKLQWALVAAAAIGLVVLALVLSDGGSSLHGG